MTGVQTCALPIFEILQKIMMAYDGHIKPEKPELPEGMEHKEGHRRGLMNK